MVRRTALFMLLVIALSLGGTAVAFAADQIAGAPAEAGAAQGLPANVKVAIAIGAGIGIAIAAFGGALGQGRGLAAALDGIARNPGAAGKMFGPMIIGLAMIESLVIYSLLVALMLIGKL
jgi:F-type H+-transporting ATPase subunit c